ncbi:MAG: GHKL domain-containing protein [Bacteroidetes bacterium]|nr:GHKL domain-containing protein [Bacteroidota bacterium]
MQPTNDLTHKLHLLRQRIKANDASAEENALELLEVAMQQNDTDTLALIYAELANIQLRLQFNYGKASDYAQVARDLVTDGSSEEVKMHVFMALGQSSQRIRDYVTAQECFLQGIAVYESLSSPSKDQTENYAYLNYYLGVVYLNIGMYSFSGEQFEKAKKLFVSLNHRKGILACRQSEASFYFHQQDYDRALAVYLELVDEYQKTKEDWLEIALDYIAQIYFKQELYEPAELYFLQALAERERIGNETRYSYSYFSLAKLYYRKGDRQLGDVYFDKLRKLIEKHPHFFSDALVLDINWDLYGERGDYEKSYHYYRQVKSSVAEPEVLEKMMRDVLAKEREKQTVSLQQAKDLKRLNLEMNQQAKALQALNQDLTNYARTASHDLREPLRMVSAYMTILESKIKDKLSEDEKQFLHFAVDGSKRMDEMITRILQSAKGGSGIYRPIDLHKIVEQVKQNLSSLLEQKNGTIYTKPLPYVVADDIQMMQVFQNLITNALKYNTSKTPEVCISFEKQADSIILSIADNGVGISAENRLRVFDMYSRVENESEESGTGIGLATVKGIVTKMKGRIWVEPNEPRGSIFKIELPTVIV